MLLKPPLAAFPPPVVISYSILIQNYIISSLGYLPALVVISYPLPVDVPYSILI